jgi:hypothetical protein
MTEVVRPAMAVSRFYWDISTEDKPLVGQPHGFYYWGNVHRGNTYRQLAALTNGTKGDMIAILPERARFAVDPRDDGRFDGWYRPEFDDKGWSSIPTTSPFFAQGDYMDKQGFPYMGAMWYRLNVDVPAAAKGKPAKLYCMAAETEAWVWVNGKFVGHRPYVEAYIRPCEVDMDVTHALVPGKTNSVVVRLHTNYQPAQLAAGLVSRLFIYSPKEAAKQ